MHMQKLLESLKRVHKVIKDKGGILLTTLHKKYIDVLSQNGISYFTYPSQSLQQKICAMYQDVVNMYKISNTLGLVMLSVDVDIHEAYAYAQKTKMQFLVEEAANILHSEVMALKDSYASLPYPLHASKR